MARQIEKKLEQRVTREVCVIAHLVTVNDPESLRMPKKSTLAETILFSFDFSLRRATPTAPSPKKEPSRNRVTGRPEMKCVDAATSPSWVAVVGKALKDSVRPSG